jgi:hypothetical protein
MCKKSGFSLLPTKVVPNRKNTKKSPAKKVTLEEGVAAKPGYPSRLD